MLQRWGWTEVCNKNHKRNIYVKHFWVVSKFWHLMNYLKNIFWFHDKSFSRVWCGLWLNLQNNFFYFYFLKHFSKNFAQTLFKTKFIAQHNKKVGKLLKICGSFSFSLLILFLIMYTLTSFILNNITSEVRLKIV